MAPSASEPERTDQRRCPVTVGERDGPDPAAGGEVDRRLRVELGLGTWLGKGKRPVRVVVLDNLKEGVLTPDIYDPTLNPLYRDVLAHYGVVALPCRVRDPDRKGKVEASVGHTQKTPLRGLRFEHLDDVRWSRLCRAPHRRDHLSRDDDDANPDRRAFLVWSETDAGPGRCRDGN